MDKTSPTARVLPGERNDIATAYRRSIPLLPSFGVQLRDDTLLVIAERAHALHPVQTLVIPNSFAAGGRERNLTIPVHQQGRRSHNINCMHHVSVAKDIVSAYHRSIPLLPSCGVQLRDDTPFEVVNPALGNPQIFAVTLDIDKTR